MAYCHHVKLVILLNAQKTKIDKSLGAVSLQP